MLKKYMFNRINTVKQFVEPVLKLNSASLMTKSWYLHVEGPFTLLAPSDGAFAKVPADALQGLKTDNAKLQEVLKYHVMKGEIFEWDLQNHEVIPSLNGHSIRVYVRTSSVNQVSWY